MFYRKMSDAAAATTAPVCPDCGKPATRQISSGAGLLFKGSGFYLTDYGKNAHRRTGGEPVPSGEKSGESASTESKPAESTVAASKTSDSKSADSKSGDAKSGDAKSADAKSASAKSGDAKAGDAKSGDGGTKAPPKTSSGSSSPKSDT